MKVKDCLAGFIALLGLWAAPAAFADSAARTGSTSPSYDVAKFRESLELARKHWDEANVRDYKINFGWRCYCHSDFISKKLITVKDGAIVSIVDLRGGKELDPKEFSRYYTIDGLFAFIDKGLQENSYFVRAAFDAESGFPVSARIDKDRNVADEEIGFEIEQLRKNR